MIGIYLLVTFLSQMSSQDSWLAMGTGPTEVTVSFAKSTPIPVGAPVVVEGELIGTVTAVDRQFKSRQVELVQRDKCDVRVKIAPRHRSLIRRGTVALISSPLSVTRTKIETVVELLIPPAGDAPLLQKDEKIHGYSSYEDYWAAGVTHPA